MKTEDMLKRMIEILENKRAKNVEVLEIAERSSLADYFLLASASSTTHVNALVDELLFQLKTVDHVLPERVEGYNNGRWTLVDYGDVWVHIFHEEDRAFYDLDSLWSKLS